MRLIDADALRARMYHDAFETDTDMQKWESGCWIRYKMFENAMDDAPAIDAVEVVRCKECKWLRYCETEELDLYLDCDKPDGGGIPRSEDWFCADGERKGE